jgi:hypothetical protein
MSSDGPSSRVGALNVPGGNLVPRFTSDVPSSCVQKREACPHVSVGRLLIATASARRHSGSKPEYPCYRTNDLLEGCPRRGHARRHRGLTRWRVHPCSSIGWTNPLSELDLRGARHEPSRPHVQWCASRVWLSTSLLDARCISTTSADGAREWRSGAALEAMRRPARPRCGCRTDRCGSARRGATWRRRRSWRPWRDAASAAPADSPRRPPPRRPARPARPRSAERCRAGGHPGPSRQ